MASLKEYQQVRVVKLLEPADSYNSWNSNDRPPKIGDVGIVVNILTANELPNRYLVDLSNSTEIICFGEFQAEELEPLEETN